MITFPKPDVEQFLRTFSIGDFIVSPDEKQLVFSTNLSGKYNLWGMDLPNTFPYPLTSIDQSCQELLFDKQGRFIIAGFDQDGNENTQFYGIPLRGGTMKEIINHENTRNFMPILSNDSQRLYYTTSRGNPSFLNSYCLDLESGQETQILEGKMRQPISLVSVLMKKPFFITSTMQIHIPSSMRRVEAVRFCLPLHPRNNIQSHTVFSSRIP